MSIVLAQAPLFLLSAHAQGWSFYLLAVGYMVSVFAAIPFTDALIVRYVDDSMRSRVAGIRLAISFGISSLAVSLLGPVVKVSGFDVLLLTMAGIALLTFCFVWMLPTQPRPQAAVQSS